MSVSDMVPDKGIAERFLALLDPTATSFFFQVYPEKGHSGQSRTYEASVVEAWPMLASVNLTGPAIAVTVNESNGGRKAADVTRIRAVWQEDDGEGKRSFPLEPSVVVESSPGKFHRYWLVEDNWPADADGRDDFQRVMRGLVREYGCDPSTIDPSRVLRLPGTLHQKAEPHTVRIISPAPDEAVWKYSRQQIVDAFAVEAEPRQIGQYNSGDRFSDSLRLAIDWAYATMARLPKPIMVFGSDWKDFQRAKRAIRFIPADDYSEWWRTGAALHHLTGGETRGFRLWDDWSRTTKRNNYDPVRQQEVWEDYRYSPKLAVTIGTLFWLARDYGWDESATPSLPPVGELAEERLSITHRPGDLVQFSMVASTNWLRQHGNNPAPQFDAGREEIAKFIQGAAEGEPSLGRNFWISSLACGVGKTVTMNEVVRQLIHRREYDHVGVVIFLSAVEQIKDALAKMELAEDEFSVLVSKDYRKDFASLGNPDPDKARVIITTQMMLTSYLKGSSTFGGIRQLRYKGKPRQVRIWDEAILPSKLHTVGVYSITGLYKYLTRLPKGHELIEALKPLVADMEKAKDQDVLFVPELDPHASLDDALGCVRSDEDERAIEALWHLQGQTARVRHDLLGNAILGYKDTFPDDMGPMLVLDASGQLKQVYREWQASERKNVRLLYSPKKSYRNLTIRPWNTGAGKDVFTTGNSARFDLYEGFCKAIDTMPKDESIFLLSFKPDEEKRFSKKGNRVDQADVEQELRDKLGLTDDDKRLMGCTWGRHTGSNDYRDCRYGIIAGVLQKGNSHHEALGRSIKDMRKAEDRLSDNDFRAIRIGETKDALFQGANRMAIRQLEDDSCPVCTLYTAFSSKGQYGTPIDVLEEMFPEATIIPWEPIYRPKGKQAMLVEAIQFPGNYSKAALMEKVGIKAGRSYHLNSLFDDDLCRHFEESLGLHIVRPLGRKEIVVTAVGSAGGYDEMSDRDRELEELPF